MSQSIATAAAAAAAARPRSTSGMSTSSVSRTGRWRSEEHDLFVEGLQKYGYNWESVAAHVSTRTVVQVRSHAQKYFNKLKKEWKESPDKSSKKSSKSADDLKDIEDDSSDDEPSGSSSTCRDTTKVSTAHGVVHTVTSLSSSCLRTFTVQRVTLLQVVPQEHTSNCCTAHM